MPLRCAPIAALLCSLLLGVHALAQEPAPAPEPTAPSVLQRLLDAPVEVRARISLLIAAKYGQLSTDIAALVAREDPAVMVQLRAELDKLISARYPALPGFITQQLDATPEIQQTLLEVIAERYPDLPARIAALPPGPDLEARAAELIQTQYPALLTDVLSRISTRRPGVLLEIQRKVQARFPALLADAGTMILVRFPVLHHRIAELVIHKYPALIADVLGILATTPPAPEPPPAPNP